MPIVPVLRWCALAVLVVAFAVPAPTARPTHACSHLVDAPVCPPVPHACVLVVSRQPRQSQYGPEPDTVVVAAADGEVTFAGTVAGTRWIVIRHGDGLLASYGRLGASRVRVGQQARG